MVERHGGRDRERVHGGTGTSGTLRSRGLEAFLGGSVRQTNDVVATSTSRAADVVDRGLALVLRDDTMRHFREHRVKWQFGRLMMWFSFKDLSFLASAIATILKLQ